jgi:sec-independent protein translocase protein TatC
MSEMSFLEHLVELRRRIILSVWGVVVGFCLIYHFSERLYDILMRPLCDVLKDKCSLVYTGLTEPFLVYLKVGLIGGIFLALPWIFYQLWKFISPGLRPQERRWVIPFVLIGSVMFAAGAVLGYFYIFPFAFEFFLSQAQGPILPMLNMSNYLSFVSGLLFAFGFLFEIPVFIVFLNVIGILSAAFLWRTWRYAIAIIFVLAAILTPADPYTMLLCGIPLSLLYVAALLVCTMIERMRKPVE